MTGFVVPDAVLVDRVAQPAFDWLFRYTDIPVTAVAVEAWAFALITNVARLADSALNGPLERIAWTAFWWLFTTLILMAFWLVAKKRHSQWLSSPARAAAALPPAYLRMAAFRMTMLILFSLLAPAAVMVILQGHAVVAASLDLLHQLAIIVACYADACRPLPPSARQQHAKILATAAAR